MITCLYQLAFPLQGAKPINLSVALTRLSPLPALWTEEGYLSCAWTAWVMATWASLKDAIAYFTVWFQFSNFINLTYYFAFLCIPRGEDGEKEEKTKEDKGKQKLRQLHTHRYGEPEVQESVFWKNIIAYQQKLLVSHSLAYVFSCWQRHVPPYSNNVKTNSICFTTFFYPPLSIKWTWSKGLMGMLEKRNT